MSEWRKSTLDQLGKIVTGKTPASSLDDAFGGAIPFVTPSDMDGRRTIRHTARFLTELGAAAISGARVPANAVMVSCIGSDMGKAAIAGSDCVTNQQINSIIIETEDSPLFVYYELSTRKSEIRGAASGSAQPILNKSAFGRFEINLPPPYEQRAIAHILGTLDDKIELNRRMNETLEAIARAMFKSWFVDFDPVRAKMSGEPPESICQRLGLTTDLLALFPDHLVDSELGEIPEGWKVGSYGDIVSQRTARIGNSEAVVLSAVASGVLIRSDEQFTKRVYSKEINKYLTVEQWDMAYNPSRINIGSIGMLEEPIIGAVSPVYVVLRPLPAYRWFLNFKLGESSTTEWINTLASGSVRQSLSFKDFSSIPCVLPPEQLTRMFDSAWLQLRESILVHANESGALTEIRDLLLPKLLSGEFPVSSGDAL